MMSDTLVKTEIELKLFYKQVIYTNFTVVFDKTINIQYFHSGIA